MDARGAGHAEILRDARLPRGSAWFLLDRLLTDGKVAREFEFAPLRQAYMDPARVKG